jgi:hypothetical protein
MNKHTFKLEMSVFSEAVIISGSLAPSALHLKKVSFQLFWLGRKKAQAQLPFALW